MTVQLYEGCWGVTRGGEMRGPMVPNQLISDPWPFKITDAAGAWVCAYGKNGTACSDVFPRDLEPHNDITTVFATEADAYLAGDNKPLGQILRDEVAKLTMKPAEYKMNAEGLAGLNKGMANTSDCPHCGLLLHTAPKPVTWPDGVTKMTIGPHQITIDAETGVIQVVWHGSVGSTPAQARQLAALLLAAADKVEGRG